MSDPRRWLDDPDAPAELRNWLSHARPAERMTAAQFQRGARRLGVATGAAASVLFWLKGPALAALLGAMSGAVFATTVPWLLEHKAPAPAPQVPAPAAVPNAPVEPNPASVTPRATSEPVKKPSHLPRVGARPRSPRPEPAAIASAVAAPRDTLAEEAQLIEQARQALGSDPGRALGLLEQHRQKYEAGKLAMERELLSVDALRRAGRVSEARARVDALLALPHKGIYEARLKQLRAALGE
jgi:hypothetical protein